MKTSAVMTSVGKELERDLPSRAGCAPARSPVDPSQRRPHGPARSPADAIVEPSALTASVSHVRLLSDWNDGASTI